MRVRTRATADNSDEAHVTNKLEGNQLSADSLIISSVPMNVEKQDDEGTESNRSRRPRPQADVQHCDIDCTKAAASPVSDSSGNVLLFSAELNGESIFVEGPRENQNPFLAGPTRNSSAPTEATGIASDGKEVTPSTLPAFLGKSDRTESGPGGIFSFNTGNCQ